MRRSQAFITLLALAASAPAFAQQPRPAAGTDVDVTRTISLSVKPPSPCISVAATGAMVLLSRDELQALVAARPASWRTEAERMALISGKRAEGFLATVSQVTDSGDCQAAPSQLDAESQYLVLEQLERGRAIVKDSKTGEPVSAVRVRYFGERCGPLCGQGRIMVYLPDGEQPFFVVSWWAS